MTNAIFDVDNTIIDHNSGIRWGWMMRRRFNLIFYLILAFYGGLYVVGLYTFDKLVKRIVKTLKNENYEEHVKIYLRKIKNKNVGFKEKVLNEIQNHLKKKHKIIMISQSMNFVLDYYIKELEKIEKYNFKVICTEIKVKNGKFYDVIPLVAQKKYERIKELHLDLKDTYFYTDSIMDRQLLRAVGHPVVVDPNLFMRVYSYFKGWKIL